MGGGCRSEELTLPGFVHDTCSTVHSLALASPFLSSLPLARARARAGAPRRAAGPPARRRLRRDAGALGGGDGAGTRPGRAGLPAAVRSARPQLPTSSCARSSARFARRAIRWCWRASARARSARRRGWRARVSRASGRAPCWPDAARTRCSRCARPASAAFGIVLALSAHQVGWPVARGGSQRLADALASHLRSLGGEIQTGRWVESLDEVAGAGATLLDVTPRQLLRLAGHRLPDRYARRLARYRYGPGVFKLDWALDGPIPWRAAEVARAGTVHLGGDARRDRRLGGGGLEGRAPRPSLRPARAAEPLRSDPSPGGQAHRLGLLPRAERLLARHDRGDRGAGGALRARVQGPDRRALGDGPGRGGAAQSQLRGRRHQRRRPGPAPALHAPGRPPGPLLDTGRRGSTSARRPRRRAAGCTGCAGTSRPAPRYEGSILLVTPTRPFDPLSSPV